MKLTNTIFIQVGDLGAGVIHIKAYELLNETLVKSNCMVYSVRGNHDDPAVFDITRNITSNFIVVKDYDVINLLDKDILFIGGAVSIDRKIRVDEGYPYWIDEPVNTDPQHLIKLSKVKNIDICVTHTAPLFCFPTGTFFEDKYLEVDIRDERKYLEVVFELIKNKGLKRWYYGHFHNAKSEIIEGVEFNLIDQNSIKNI